LKLNISNAFEPKILRSERERFGLIMNFFSKTNMFDFFGDVSRKTKALLVHIHIVQYVCSRQEIVAALQSLRENPRELDKYWLKLDQFAKSQEFSTQYK
jgi:hypothetical protein